MVWFLARCQDIDGLYPKVGDDDMGTHYYRQGVKPLHVLLGGGEKAHQAPFGCVLDPGDGTRVGRDPFAGSHGRSWDLRRHRFTHRAFSPSSKNCSVSWEDMDACNKIRQTPERNGRRCCLTLGRNL